MFLSGVADSVEHMFDVVVRPDSRLDRVEVDPLEVVFDPDDSFDWFGLTAAGAESWLLDDPDPAGGDLVGGAVARLDGWARLVSVVQARMVAAVWGVAGEYQELGFDESEGLSEVTATEVRAALCLTRRAADRQVDLAYRLVVRLPEVLEWLGSGRIDLARAGVLADETMILSENDARVVCDRVLDRAQRLTTGQLRVLVRKLCLEFDPDAITARKAVEVCERRVWTELSEVGTAEIGGVGLDPVRVARAMNRIERLAQTLRTPQEERTIDQLRADVFLDLLEGTGPAVGSGRRGVVDIRVELSTLLGLDRKVAEVAGLGPILDDVIDRLDLSGRWQVTVTDRGRLVDSVVTRRRPTGEMRRRVEARDLTCVFPGCRMPASQCDLDHRQQFSEGGLTHPDQLVALCRHDHVIRHRAGWTHRPTSNGGHQWTSPLGNTYTRPPP